MGELVPTTQPGLSMIRSGQSHERFLEERFAVLRRPYGTPAHFGASFPALKRWAYKPRAYGAMEI
jgi:hypothetical protein